ncbi:MFS transporter [Thermoflexus sp.]|uniref:MFS transporter n=1 Tax=Thermoflexus sp. TaxID=1969742 RepID=UPI0035E42EFD
MAALTMTFDEAIDRVGLGRFQYKLMAICGAGWAADAMEVLLISFALPAIRREWGLTTAQAGLLGTAIFLGMLAGAWFWGTLSDRIGRRLGFILTVLIDSGFGLLSAFSPNFATLVLLRALTGFGVGGTLPVDYAIFAEYLPRQKRGRYLVYLEAFWALGALIAAGLAWLIVPRVGWRPLLAISALPGLIVFWIRRYVPESPRFLLVHGREEEARSVLAQVARENGAALPEGIRLIAPAAPHVTVGDLWRRPYTRTTALLWLIWFGISLGYYGVFTWLPSLLVQRGLTFLRSFEYIFIITLAQLPGYFSAAYLVEQIGRRRTLGFYLLASGIFTYLFAVAASLPAYLAAAIWMSFFALGAWGALYAYTPEAYPTQLRTTGMGAASGMTRIAGALAPTLGGYLLGVSMPLALTVFAAAYGISGLAALSLPYETRGRPLADVVGELR